MLPLSQQIRAGLVLNELYEEHFLVRCFVSLVLVVAPRKYKRVFRLRELLADWLL